MPGPVEVFVCAAMAVSLASSCSSARTSNPPDALAPLATAAGWTPEVELILTQRGDARFASCMAQRAGVSTPPVLRPDGWQNQVVGLSTDLLTPSIAKSAGYGIADTLTRPPAVVQSDVALIDPVVEAACHVEADAVSRPPSDLEAQFESLQHEAEARIQTDSGVVSARLQWTKCMRGVGVEVTDVTQIPTAIGIVAAEQLARSGQGIAVAAPEDPALGSTPSPQLVSDVRGMASAGLSTAETRLATWDADCRVASGYNTAVVAARRAVQQHLVDANSALLSDYHAAVNSLLNSA